ncbi:RidA family protein [Sphaerimonospora thailandensis]|uniref:Enamine deaminase RidA n=1 Tax=Sphaerimonospora thailandensis TaxID=795644 RepID=A0A8J3R2U2_9ACTN|nr:RidA family protein [Sphaerimonospora thailandensis]GIH68032.1 enamine deaminase RidA [Sphaerimonospora thailandensis]
MRIERFNPPGLQPTRGVTHVVRTTGGSTLHLSGQGAYNAENRLVGPGDYYAQCTQAFANVVTALEAAGATFADVVKATYYVVGLNQESLRQFSRALHEVPGYSPDRPPASTMIGVAALAYDEMLVEFDVTAVLP